jgi:hypothetical protein
VETTWCVAVSNQLLLATRHHSNLD